MPTRDEHVAALKRQLDKWNEEIARWEVKAAGAKDELRRRYRAELEKVTQKREKAMYGLKLLENAALSAWGDLRWGVDDAWDRMHDAMKEARSHFERAHPPESTPPQGSGRSSPRY